MAINLLRRLTYQPAIANLARRVGLAPALRNLYYRWVAPGDIFKIQISRVHFSLYARSADELRFLEGQVVPEGMAWSERGMLEAFLAFLGPGNIVYDVGANFGLFSIALSKMVGHEGQIIAFEPLSSNLGRLQANIQLNGLRNIRCFPQALGNQRARVEMCLDQERPWLSTLLPKMGSQPTRSTAKELVEVVEGDSFRIEHHLPVPHAVKLDVEGFEHFVMCGLRRTLSDAQCRMLCCEVHPRMLPPGITPDHVVVLARSFGFTRIDTHTEGPQQHLVCYKE